MSTTHDARTGALHLVVATCDVDARRIHDLVAPLAERVAGVTLLLPPAADGLGPLRTALRLADAIEAACGRRPRAIDADARGGDRGLADALARAGTGAIVAVPADLRGRRLRALRRAAARAGAHLAVVPRAGAR